MALLKVAFVITGLSTGGAEMMLLKLLEKIDRNIFDPSVISLTNKGEIGAHIEKLGIPLLVLNMKKGIPNPLKLIHLIFHFRKNRPDIIHTWMYHADLLGGIAGRFSGCRRIIWGIHHSNLSKSENKRSTLIVVKLCALLSSKVPAHILSCSNRAALVHSKFGYDRRKFHIIPNGFDVDKYHPDELAIPSIRNELGLKEDTPIVGLIARFDPLKNHLGFIGAAALVSKKRPDVHFLLAGTGVDEKNHILKNSIECYADLASKIHLLGRRDDVPRLMAGMNILASPSHGEAFPNVLGEAMACGVPCVVTDVGDSAEIVGNTGYVVPQGDMEGFARALLKALALTQGEYIDVAARARKRVQENYEISYVVKLYENFYIDIYKVDSSI